MVVLTREEKAFQKRLREDWYRDQRPTTEEELVLIEQAVRAMVILKRIRTIEMRMWAEASPGEYLPIEAVKFVLRYLPRWSKSLHRAIRGLERIAKAKLRAKSQNEAARISTQTLLNKSVETSNSDSRTASDRGARVVGQPGSDRRDDTGGRTPGAFEDGNLGEPSNERTDRAKSQIEAVEISPQVLSVTTVHAHENGSGTATDSATDRGTRGAGGPCSRSEEPTEGQRPTVHHGKGNPARTGTGAIGANDTVKSQIEATPNSTQPLVRSRLAFLVRVAAGVVLGAGVLLAGTAGQGAGVSRRADVLSNMGVMRTGDDPTALTVDQKCDDRGP